MRQTYKGLWFILIVVLPYQHVLFSDPAPILAPPNHPRLFFMAGDIDTLQAQAATTHHDIWVPIQDYVDSLLGTTPPASASPDWDQQEYTRYGDMLIPLAFACVITESPDYCDLAKTYLLTYANWTQWDTQNERSLGYAHLLMGNALAYDWMYDILSPEERQTVGQSLAIRAQMAYEASVSTYRSGWSNFWTKAYLQNHFYIIHSALGMAGLALLDEPILSDCSVKASANVNLRAGPGTDYDILGQLNAGQSASVRAQTVGDDGFVWWQLDEDVWVRSDVVQESAGCETLHSFEPQLWIDQARRKLSVGRDVLNSIGDASWHEGIHYQTYMLTMMLPFLVNLEQLQGFDLLPHQYLLKYPAWCIYNHLPNSLQYILAYGDFEWTWSNSFKPQNVLRFIANRYDDGYAEWMAQQLIAADGRWSEIWSTPWYVFEFLYYDPTITPEPPQDFDTARVFTDLEGVIWRTGWDDDALIFGLKTGAYGGRFAFDTFSQGLYPWEPPCAETGCGLHSGHDHDDANGFYISRGEYWLAAETVGVDLNDTRFHNTILIDGQGQYRPPDDHNGTYPEEYIGSDGFLQASADSVNFNYVAANATRRYKQINGIQVITRYVVFVRPDYFVMLDNFAADTAHDYTWVLHFTEGVSVEDNWIRGEAGDGQLLGVRLVAPQTFQAVLGDDGLPYVHVQTASPAGDVRFIHVLYPTDHASWNNRPTVNLLDDNGQAAAVQVHMNDGSGRRDDILIAYTQSVSVLDIGPYQYDGQVAVISTGPDGNLERLFIYGGTFLAEQSGERLADSLNPDEPFEAVYTGETVRVYGERLSEVMLYAPDATELVLNGTSWPFTREGDYITFFQYSARTTAQPPAWDRLYVSWK